MKIHGEEMSVQQLISQLYTDHEFEDVLQRACLSARYRKWKKTREHNPDVGYARVGKPLEAFV